ncbi:hypothetical protein HRR83_001162 [Exophiala dermatitidis]|uniref:NADH dehydrogenase [ubiquinone] 1 alpha subcomplex subunit 11 n=2 Tax=Exophiala dermatitidis TaxID=5970 RepID=H6C765_EXODN|nr:uncharacterized protein HMPREF1120_07549 [Exophiala dermatitidis NIH/UT8656]KAJ4522672.1 hypothetical protein HRR75_001066 [Exophiala dermatitidis]EHY59561.1 hypothetical protein HMPREF1120_07549 [Exophiala dermatitidis NIH/UT8656]KAJ4525973.1 hypothetical protein HRR74_001166 [Exophiala dermatitidis]KAJ4527080.1 hypothetical protein HRR73_001877 [Exophiala dermatitidis]KAJ4532798.1 hypothetical protein HRR76_007778 [Exophiala dermatitidis]
MADIFDSKPTYNSEEPVYQPKDALATSLRGATLAGAAGLFLASVQNTMAKGDVGILSVFTRFGTTVGLFTAVGGTFAFTTTACANLREKNDPWNHGIGGAIAGALPGLAKRSMPATLGGSFALGASMAVASYTGRSVFESASDEPQLDRIGYKEEAKTRYRRPINETINELGEGRGIYGPGYEERRKQRIKEKYGIDIQQPYYMGASSPPAE